MKSPLSEVEEAGRRRLRADTAAVRQVSWLSRRHRRESFGRTDGGTRSAEAECEPFAIALH